MTALPRHRAPVDFEMAPAQADTAAAKASPRVRSRSVASSILAATAGSSQAPKPSTRAAAANRRSARNRPRSRAPHPGASQEMRICGSLRRIQRRAIELGAGPGEFGLELADAPRPDPAADQVKDGGDGRRAASATGWRGQRHWPARKPRRTPGGPARRAAARRPGRTPARPQAGKAPGPPAASAARARSNLASARRFRGAAPRRTPATNRLLENPAATSAPAGPFADRLPPPGRSESALLRLTKSLPQSR